MEKIKLVLLTITSLLLISCVSSLPATEPSTKMMKEADTIIITVDQSPKEAYKGFYQHLSDKGFGFRNTDRNLMLLKTDFQNYGSSIDSYAFSINASIRSDSVTAIVVSGKGSMGIGNEYEIYKSNNLFDNKGKSWKKMNEIVKEYPHQEIYYRRNLN